MDLYEVAPVDQGTVRQAMTVAVRCPPSHRKAFIVAAALEAGCGVLYARRTWSTSRFLMGV
jgi:predicted nucleic acid-binding protein